MKHAKPKHKVVRRPIARPRNRQMYINIVDLHENDVQSLTSCCAILIVSMLTVVACAISTSTGHQLQPYQLLIGGLAALMFSGTLPASLVLLSVASSKFQIKENLSLSIDNLDRLRSLMPVIVIVAIMVIAAIAGVCWISSGLSSLVAIES